jgi:hypothetical protein
LLTDDGSDVPIDLVNDAVPLDGVTVRLDENAGSIVVVDDAAPLDGFDCRIMKTVTTAAAAATAPTIIPTNSISSERLIFSPLDTVGAGAGSRKDSVGKVAEHVVVSDWKGFSLLQQLRWL